MKIVLSGGGTMGSVSPLIAVYQEIKKENPSAEFLFIGTKHGPEKEAVKSYKINFQAINSGKLRRYLNWHNFIDPFKISVGFFQSWLILKKFQPNVVMVAGGFVGVPVAYAARLLKIPILIHQQDIIAGLANKLMANIADRITVSFEPSLGDFAPVKTILTGNPVRPEFFICQKERSREIFGLKKDLPTLLVLGGGTGAQKINETVEKSLAELLQFCQVVHLTGKGKRVNVKAENYHQFEFLNHEMPDAFCAADLVVSRAGISSLSELTVLSKPAILIPIPRSHQEANAQYYQKNNAAAVLNQDGLDHSVFIGAVSEIVAHEASMDNLSRNIAKMMKPDGAGKVAEVLLEIAK